MPKKPTILSTEIVAKSRLFWIEAQELEFSNGERRSYERLLRGDSGGAVLIVPMLDNNTVLLLREYATGVQRYELALPKGRVEPGEPILEAANRELQEEMGYAAKSLGHITSVSIAPSYLEHMTEIILAQDLYPQTLLGDEPEPLEVVPWQMDNLNALFSLDECTEARSIAALFLTKAYLQK